MKSLQAGIGLLLLLICLKVAASPVTLPSLWGAQQQYGSLRSKGFGLLTVFWPQEAVGTPEGHRHLAAMAQAGFKFYGAGLAIFEESVSLDAAFLQARIAPELIAALEDDVAGHDTMLQKHKDEWHTEETEEYEEIINDWQARQLGVGGKHVTAVANLMSGKPPVGISRTGTIVAEVERIYDEYEGEEEDLSYMYLTSNTSLPIDIINMSTYFMIFEATQAMSKYADDVGGAIQVMYAGNDFPTPLYGHGDDGTQLLSFITVGSCAPTGYFSYFTRAGKHLTISAPSDADIQTIAAGTGELTSFGGTSGAVPLVSGALADVLSIIPNLNLDEAIHILQTTAIPTAINARDEGSGVLNYYKLLRVAEKIHHAATGDQQKIKRLIYDDSMYDFRAEAQQYQQAAQADPANALFALRLAFFLDPHDNDTRSQLAAIYRQAGYVSQALFYDNPTTASDDPRIANIANYRQLLQRVTQIPVFDDSGTDFSAAFRHYLKLAINHPQRPEMLEMLVSRLTHAELLAAQFSGDLMQDLQLDPAALAKEKPYLFAALKRQQRRLLD